MFRMLVVLLALIPSLCLGDTIPPKLAELIKVYQTTGSSLENGVLRVGIRKPVVYFDMYDRFIEGACTPLWFTGKKDGWNKAKIDRIEVMNDIGKQGFAFITPRESCNGLGKTNGSTHKPYLNSKTWVCVSGNPCRERRIGETTSGD